VIILDIIGNKRFPLIANFSSYSRLATIEYKDIIPIFSLDNLVNFLPPVISHVNINSVYFIKFWCFCPDYLNIFLKY